MPIFQDPDRQCGYDVPLHDRPDGKKGAERLYSRVEHEEPREEYTRAANVENLERISPVDNMESNSPTLETSDREELMQSIKRGESPTWVLNRTVSWFQGFHGSYLYRAMGTWPNLTKGTARRLLHEP